MLYRIGPHKDFQAKSNPLSKCKSPRARDARQCPVGCFKKDTLKKNETFTPARNWGVPRKFISRRKCWSHKSRGLAKWLKVWQNRRRRRDDHDALTMALRSRRRRDRYELKRIIFLTLLDAWHHQAWFGMKYLPLRQNCQKSHFPPKPKLPRNHVETLQ